jgi:RNA polymerase sigma-70 factor (ECF subfamily)
VSLGPQLLARLHERSGAARWGLTVDDFRATLEESVARAFAAKDPSAAEIEKYLEALHLADLALARACIAGREPAWEHVVREHRATLLRAADAIDPSGGARELAEGIFAELFGLRERDGARQPLFRYFHGRSSLATWLRAILSQRYVDRVRARRRERPLPDEESARDRAALSSAAAGHPAEPHPERARFAEAMRRALAGAIAALAPRDRIRLTCYYTQDMKLAAIGRLLGEHEASVSRHLTRIRGEIREAVERSLREDHRFDDRAVAECVRSVLDDAGALDLTKLVGKEAAVRAGGKNPGRDRSR